MKQATHNPSNTHVKIAGKVHEVGKAGWSYGMVVYTLKGSGNRYYSWEIGVEAVDNAWHIAHNQLRYTHESNQDRRN